MNPQDKETGNMNMPHICAFNCACKFNEKVMCGCGCNMVMGERAVVQGPKGTFRARAERCWNLDKSTTLYRIECALEELAQEKDRGWDTYFKKNLDAALDERDKLLEENIRLEHANNLQADLLIEYSAKIEALESELNGYRQARDA